MKKVIITLSMILAFGSAFANEKKLSSDEKLIKEVKAEMEEPIFFITDIEQKADVLIYNIDGQLLHSFQKDKIDYIAMRNVDLIMETKTQKIFIKVKELNPTI
ncbi:hypothetical protein [Marivirga sp.]|uniref:hypothetical protein n=1 Tax=Marivirga sp. TaxID=2018662 RepID=UPI002D7FB67A|nr:hypothetical protein [Marivirga sp.]HET8861164.1 hypothetical protein [Marivirga sp.]